jgi:hypothetical protein
MVLVVSKAAFAAAELLEFEFKLEPGELELKFSMVTALAAGPLLKLKPLLLVLSLELLL